MFKSEIERIGKAGYIELPTRLNDNMVFGCDEEEFGHKWWFEFDDDNEALNLANDTDFGLLASIWTENPQREQFFVSRLETGIVGVNNNGRIDHRTPWGGFKQSGIGRRYGQLGLDVFYECKTIWKSNLLANSD